MDTGHTEPDTSAEVEREPRVVRYPTNHVVGAIDTVEQAERACQALLAGGFLESEVSVVTGQEAANRLHASTGRTGLADLAIRIADRLGLADDEMAVKATYEQALRDGAFLINVAAPSDERKDRAAQILLANGGRSVKHLGRFTIEHIHRERAP